MHLMATRSCISSFSNYVMPGKIFPQDVDVYIFSCQLCVCVGVWVRVRACVYMEETVHQHVLGKDQTCKQTFLPCFVALFFKAL